MKHLAITTSTDRPASETLEAVERYIYTGKVVAAVTDVARRQTRVLVTDVPEQLAQSQCDRLASGLYFAQPFDTEAEARVAVGLDDPAFTATTPPVVCPRCGEGVISITVQSWENTTFRNGVKAEVEIDSESLDFFASATCAACELTLQANGGGLRDASLSDKHGEVNDDAMADAFVVLVERLYAGLGG